MSDPGPQIRLTQSDWKRRMALAALLPLAALGPVLISSVGQGNASAQGSFTVQQRIDQFGEAARQRLEPHYAAAGLTYPGVRAALLAFKDERRLELQVRDESGSWRFVRSYPILAASGGPGPKLREGDLQVPEGIYRVTFLNANSLYHVSLRLDYPNAFDRQMARREGRSDLGGDIMIHGKAVSVGCLAMGDEVAEELFTLAASLGQSNIEVLIAPSDFRTRALAEVAPEPPWLGQLYSRIAAALAAYPKATAR